MIRDKDELLATARSFHTSRVLLTAAELDVFTALEKSPATAKDLAVSLELHPRATRRLLDCLVNLGLIRKEHALYHVSKLGRLLSSRHPESLRPILLHSSHLWNNWSHLSETVRRGFNPQRKGVTEMGGEVLRDFIGAMHAIGRGLSQEIARAYDASRFRCLLDIGGGSGTYTIALLEAYPHLRGVLFDLPDVIEIARERLGEAGLLERARLVAGSFYEQDLPTGCDLALLSAIIHQNSLDQNLELFRKVHRALEPGGVLLIRDHIMKEDRSRPPAGAVFALNMLVCTERGDTYTFAEVSTSLKQAGFDSVRLVREGDRMDCLVEATAAGGPSPHSLLRSLQ